MNADKFFEQYSIEEISKRTKISPISLRYIKNKEYEKIPKVKFYGFINIIQREFKVDLSDLIDEYNSTLSIPKEESQKPKTTAPAVKKEKNNLIFILSLVLLLMTGAIIYYATSSNTESQNETNETPLEIKEQTITNEQNITDNTSEKKITTNEKNVTTSNVVVLENNNNIAETPQNTEVETKNENNKTLAISSVTIIPNEKVWYRAVNLDTNKTYEYLTSNPKTLPGSNYFIKFGHGNVTIEYGNKIIEPNTKKIVRILLKNGNYKYVDKGFKP
jgi:cytoskeletal protein RodZ